MALTSGTVWLPIMAIPSFPWLVALPSMLQQSTTVLVTRRNYKTLTRDNLNYEEIKHLQFVRLNRRCKHYCWRTWGITGRRRCFIRHKITRQLIYTQQKLNLSAILVRSEIETNLSESDFSEVLWEQCMQTTHFPTQLARRQIVTIALTYIEHENKCRQKIIIPKIVTRSGDRNSYAVPCMWHKVMIVVIIRHHLVDHFYP